MMNLVGTVLVWVGLVLGAAGVVCLAKPLKWLRIPTRSVALGVAGCGAIVTLIGMSLPAPTSRTPGAPAGSSAAPAQKLDEWMPEWQFSEFHEQRVRASAEQVYRAIREVTASEIFLFRTLTWIRNPRFGRAQDEHILNPPADKPILDAALKGGFVLLVEDPPRETVLGTVVVSDGTATSHDATGLRARLARPGNAIATINFRVTDDGGGWCRVTTETRVYATNAAARQNFARYWRVIYLGSSLLRFTWLRAIAHRAEKAPLH